MPAAPVILNNTPLVAFWVLGRFDLLRGPVRGGNNLLPCYRFILNQYPDRRFTSCPDCGKLAKWRKFVLLEILENVADFREVLQIHVGFAGWYPKDEE